MSMSRSSSEDPGIPLLLLLPPLLLPQLAKFLLAVDAGIMNIFAYNSLPTGIVFFAYDNQGFRPGPEWPRGTPFCQFPLSNSSHKNPPAWAKGARDRVAGLGWGWLGWLPGLGWGLLG